MKKNTFAWQTFAVLLFVAMSALDSEDATLPIVIFVLSLIGLLITYWKENKKAKNM